MARAQPLILSTLAAVVLFFAASGTCSASTSGSTPSVARLRSALLRLQDLPPGYGKTKPSSSSAANSSCLGSAKLPSGKNKRSAEADFSKGTVGPFVLESVSAAKRGTAAPTMAKLKRALKRCGTFREKNADGSVDVYTISTISFPRLGNERTAFRMDITISGGSGPAAEFDFALIRRGDIILLLSEGGLGSADADLLISLAHKALHRVHSAKLG